MSVLLAFAPFVVFALVDRIVGPTEGLFAGTLVSLGLIARDIMTPGRTPKLLEIGTMLLFGSLALYAVLGSPTWSVIAVRLIVDAGLLVIVLATIILGRPFTLQYAREHVDPDLHGSPEFVRTNYVISAVWAFAFAVMVIAELTLLYRPDVPHQIGVAAIILALVGAVKFTGWYPDRARRTGSA